MAQTNRGRLALALLFPLTAPLAAQNSPRGAVEVPLSVRGQRLLVPVQTRGGETLEFMLSTGTGVTVLSESAARGAPAGEGLALGGIPVPSGGAEIIADDRLLVDGKVVDGMIGSNLLSQFEVLIDAPGGKLRLLPIGRPPVWEGVVLSAPIHLRVYHGVVLGLDVELNGHPYPAMLEIGTPSLIVNERAGLEAGVGQGGTGTLRVGPSTFPGLPVRVEDLDVIRRFSPNGDGFVLVGAPLAGDCAISISFARQELRTCVR